MENLTVLVTGGSGFVGGMVCRLLVDQGHQVINIDRVKKEIPGVTQYPFDISNHQIPGLIKLLRPDVLVHLAADHEVGRSVQDPGVYYWNNVANTIWLLNHCVAAGVKHMVFSSSSSVYGNTAEYPTRESAQINPLSPYAKTKAIVERVLVDYQTAYGLSYTSLRYFNAAGAAPDLSHGYIQNPATHLIPTLARCAAKGGAATVFGSDYNTVDGTAVRDYTHLHDVARAHLCAIDYLTAGGGSDIFNIGAGAGHSVLEVLSEFERITGREIKYQIGDRRAGDVEATCADVSKAQSVLNWSPVYTLPDIIKHAYEWERKQK